MTIPVETIYLFPQTLRLSSSRRSLPIIRLLPPSG
ncbi:hypothetical protein OROMI_008811 [Orobanche minor]